MSRSSSIFQEAEGISYYVTSSKFFWISSHAGVRRAWEMKHSLTVNHCIIPTSSFPLLQPLTKFRSFNCSFLTHSASLISRASCQLQAEQSPQESFPLEMRLFASCWTASLLMTRTYPKELSPKRLIYMYLLTPCSPPCEKPHCDDFAPCAREETGKFSNLLRTDTSSPYANSIIKA